MEEENIAGTVAHGDGKFSVLDGVTVGAANGVEELRLGEGNQEFLLQSRGVARDVKVIVDVGVSHVGTYLGEVVDGLVNVVFVAGDRLRGEDDFVPRLDVNEVVLTNGGSGQGGFGLTLAAGDDDADLLGWKFVNLAFVDDGFGVDVEETQFGGGTNILFDGTAEESNFAAMGDGDIDGLLDTVNIATHGSDDELALGVTDLSFESVGEERFGERVTGLFATKTVGK